MANNVLISVRSTISTSKLVIVPRRRRRRGVLAYQGYLVGHICPSLLLVLLLLFQGPNVLRLVHRYTFRN